MSIRFTRLRFRPPMARGIGIRISIHRHGHIAIDTRRGQRIISWGQG